MYVIVTTDKDFAEEARKGGAQVFDINNTEDKIERCLVINDTADEDAVVENLKSLAFKPNLLGYHYFKYILTKCRKNPEYAKESMTKTIYPDCAKAFGTTPSRVERALRHSVEKSYKKVVERYDSLFGYELGDTPNNSEFICMMTEHLAQQKA